jgi:hypothetical protein
MSVFAFYIRSEALENRNKLRAYGTPGLFRWQVARGSGSSALPVLASLQLPILGMKHEEDCSTITLY